MMKVTLVDSDTLYIECKKAPIAETRDLNEDTLLELDPAGQIVALTLEDSTERTGIPAFTYDHVAA